MDAPDETSTAFKLAREDLLLCTRPWGNEQIIYDGQRVMENHGKPPEWWF